jgi:hypothetical protein
MMKKIQNYLLFLMLIFFGVSTFGQNKIDTRIDNWRYWKEKAEQKIISFNSNDPVKSAVYVKNLNISADATDIVLINGGSTTQSENSIFVNPTDNQIGLISNNSTSGSNVNGTNALFSFNGGSSWVGGVGGAGGNNSGDPATAINLNGTSFIGHIATGGGQGVSVSANNGTTWTTNVIADGTDGFLDKNHLWVDNATNSSFQGNLYSSWTSIGGSHANQIDISRSTNNGTSWSTPNAISTAVNAGSHNQGVNIQTGPNGDVYAVWAIYDSWPSRENALGFARSTNGGVTFSSATRIHNNIQGIRWQPGFSIGRPHGKNMRTNSFPSMAVDISGGSNSGTIYVVWSNVGEPGINTGTDVSIYLMRSTNNGVSWSTPTRINQDSLGNVQYFPWVTSDPITGNLSVIFYDDRNAGAAELETWVANSSDGGNTWDDFRVSDVTFTPAPISGLAGGYMGDYLGISARGGKVYPVWADNRSGTVLSYTSPYKLSAGCSENLTITTNVASGTNDIQESSNQIIATNIILSGGNALYDAGSRVLLKPGFNAKSGGVFRAFIEGCNTSVSKISNNTENYVKASKSKMVEQFQYKNYFIELTTFPNPTTSIFTIDIKEDILNDFEVKIYSMSKGLVYNNKFKEKDISSFQVDISKFPKGIYYIKLIDSKTNNEYQGKIIKD